MNINHLKSIYIIFFCAGILTVSCEKKQIEPIVTTTGTTTDVGTPGSCNNCHNVAFPEHLTNGHLKHTEGLYTFACSTCHYGHGDGNPTHQNGDKNITFNPNGIAMRNGNDTVVPVWDPATKTCDNVYCHSNGRSADRGTDGTYDWASGGTGLGPNVATYLTTPNWETGKITTCICHNGLGNMTAPYTVERPNTLDTSDYPAFGEHRKGAHMSNNKTFSDSTKYGSPIWGGVQCFWCHNPNGANSIAGPIPQGTYGSSFHVDGETYFKPLNISAGGTMADSLSYSSNGSNAHCGNSKNCW